MAIVLVIIGLIAVGALKAASAIRENTGISETAKRTDTVVTALRTFLMRNNRLPCPARAILPETDLNYVVEARTGGNCNASTRVGGTNAHSGVLPVRNLGLSRLLDAWDRQFTYEVILEATQDNSFTSNAWPPTFGLQDGSGTNLMPNGNGVVVIISHGANGSGAYLANGKPMDPPIPTAVNELENVDTDDLMFISAAYSNDDTNPFDDQVLVLTEDQIVQPLADQGALKTKQTLALETIRTIQDAILGAAMAGRSGTPISYPLPEAIPADILDTDPWGTSINYERGAAVIITGITATPPPDGAEVAYTIQSNGPNTDTDGGAPDDILFTVTVGELRGIFTKTGF